MESLPVVRRARTNMSGDIFVVGCVFVDPAIHVTIIEDQVQEGDEAVEVLLNLSRSGRGAATLRACSIVCVSVFLFERIDA